MQFLPANTMWYKGNVYILCFMKCDNGVVEFIARLVVDFLPREKDKKY
jgi:hypothetical protein